MEPAARIDYVCASPVLRPAVRAAGIRESKLSLGRAAGAASGPAPVRSLAQLLGMDARDIDDRRASDHLPVWVEFEWAGGAE